MEDVLKQPSLDEMVDRRLDYRIKFDVPIQVEYDSYNRKLTQERAIASQLSRRGLMLFARRSLPSNSELLLRIPLPTCDFPIQPTARINWTSSRNGGGTVHGLEFLYVPKIHQPYLNQFLNKHISKERIHERRLKSEIISELIQFKNKRGKRIIGFHDHQLITDLSAPFLVIPSSYGETKTNAIQIAYYLASNGFNVLRFDIADHVGESEGYHIDYTLPKVKEDIASALDFVESLAPKSKIGIVAASLSARSAFKLISEDSRPDLVVSIVGIVHVQDTFRRIQQEDLIKYHLSGGKIGTTNILGLDVNGDQTIRECIENSMHSLESTIEDLSKGRCPVVFLFGEKDPWLCPHDVKKVMNSMLREKREFHQIAAMHKLKENPLEAKRAFRLIVSAAMKFLKGKTSSSENIIEPRTREIGVQARVEKERARQLSEFTSDDQNQFWKDYLKRFNYIYSIADYRELLDMIYSELSPFKAGHLIFDAGCGNGNFGLWLISKLADECKRSKGLNKMSLQYFGTDIVEEALKQAAQVHRVAQDSVKKDLGLHRDFLAVNYQKLDMNHSLSFMDESIDKISCNLVISYLDDAVFSLRELIRILKPGGKLVLTTLKKDADISQIYRNFVEKASSAEEIEEAKNLLSNGGKIVLKEAEGFFRFYTASEFEKLLKMTHPQGSVKLQSCFSNQALLATVVK